MSNEIQFVLSLSILLPCTAGIVRVKNIPAIYYPLILIVWLGLITEIISYYLINNAIAVNIFSLIEFLLFCLQFRLWKSILYKNSTFYLLTVGMLIFWMVDNIVLMKINNFNSYFLILYPFVLVLLAVNQLNFLIVNFRGNILKNAIFILCIAVIIFYSYKSLSEIFYHYAQDSRTRIAIFSVQIYMNVLFNILFTLAVLCIPRNKTFIRPS